MRRLLCFLMTVALAGTARADRWPKTPGSSSSGTTYVSTVAGSLLIGDGAGGFAETTDVTVGAGDVGVTGAHVADPGSANLASYGNDGAAWEGATNDGFEWRLSVADAGSDYALGLEVDGKVTVPNIIQSSGSNNIMLYNGSGGGIALNGSGVSIYSGTVHHLGASVDYQFSSGTRLGWADTADSTAGSVDVGLTRTAASALTLDNGAGGAAALTVTGTIESSAASTTTIQTGADTACGTTCAGHGAAILGVNDTAGVHTIVGPTDATADICICLGPS